MTDKDLFLKMLTTEKISLNDNQINQFLAYKDLLIEWNKKFNLTSITEPKEIFNKHFIDSLSIVSLIKDKNYIIDIGTGAGFPGIPLKIVFPDIKIVLLDSTNKKIAFLNEVATKLGLKNIQMINGRSEEISKENQYREKFDLCVSRAVANLRVLSELALPFVKIGGNFVAYKGSNAIAEISESKNTINILGGEITETINYCLPDSEINHCLIIISKKYKTPTAYPRIMGKILKNPIKL